MPRKPVEPALRELPLAVIDPPSLAMRETMDAAGLEDLTRSIAAMGVLLPLIVHPSGHGRYEIEDGHRRFVCAVRAGLKTVPAIVRQARESAEAVKCHANWHRENVNPAEEARYLAELLAAECGGDVDALCELIGQKRGYVEGRLKLLEGDPEVLDAVRRGVCPMAVADELNKIPDLGYRRMYLDAAARGGATARMVREWRLGIPAAPAEAPATPTDGANQFTSLPPPTLTMQCLCCGQSERPWDLGLVYLCRGGCQALVERLLARLAEAH